jgi:glutamate-ammonia-ligase adenylyltransferase
VLSPAHADVLSPAGKLYMALSQILRLCLDGPFDPQNAPRGLKQLLAQAAELPDFAHLEGALSESQTAVAALYDEIVQ